MSEDLKIGETLMLLGFALLAMASPLVNYLVSERKGRDRYGWVALGIIAPILSTLVLLLLGRAPMGKA